MDAGSDGDKVPAGASDREGLASTDAEMIGLAVAGL